MESAVSSGAIARSSFAHISVDSTVMEKKIAHPADSGLMEKLRVKLVAFLQEHGLSIRQTYSREGPQLAWQIGCFCPYQAVQTYA